MKIFLAALLVAVVVADTKYPAKFDKDKIVQIIRNFCAIERKSVKDYADCNDAQGYRFSITGPGCAIACPATYSSINSIETFYDFVCEGKVQDKKTFEPSQAAIDLTSCDVTIQELYKKDDDATGKLKVNTDCAAKYAA